jgi:IK cytokine
MRTEIGSDDEEEDFTKMDSRNRLKRWDFETDQQYEEYESKREATPKAAFQFGVKTKGM